MLRLTVTLLGLAAVVLSTPQHHSSRGKDYDTQNRGVKSVFIDRDEPVIPQEYSDAHATFSLNILKNPYFTQTLEKYGAVSVSPFSFGHALALVGEKQYKTRTSFQRLSTSPLSRRSQRHTLSRLRLMKT
jgi:hypothetical protein